MITFVLRHRSGETLLVRTLGVPDLGRRSDLDLRLG